MTLATTGFMGCPVLGVGLGLRQSLLKGIWAATDILDWLEITPENYMGKGGRSIQTLEQAQAVYPLVSHGVNLSIGGTDAWDEGYLDSLKQLFKTVQPPWFSDHLCFSTQGNNYFNDLIPLPRTKEAVQHVVKRIQFIQNTFEQPFLIENISYYVNAPNSELPEHGFLTDILEQSNCGLLLDVNNVYVNAQNHGWDAKTFLSQIPLERVVQIHVAGHKHYPEAIVDTHGSSVCDDVWELLAWVLERTKPCGVMLERDLNIPPFEELRPELLKIRELWDTTQGAPQTHKKAEAALCV